jgi:hypothetical protein
MTNDDIIKDIAIKLMGWNPPDPSLVPNGNYTYFHDLKLYCDADLDIEISAELWNKSVYWHDKDGKLIKLDGKYLCGPYLDFDPSNNANHLLQIIDHIIENHFFSFSCYKTSPFSSVSVGWTVLFSKSVYPPAIPPNSTDSAKIFWGHDKNYNTAAIQAIIKIMEKL